MLDAMLQLFEIVPDYDLDVMSDDQSPGQVMATMLSNLEPILREAKPDWVLVQGDTTTTAAAALSAFHQGMKVGHIEAGLRTGDKWQPFPEEINRRIVSLIADLHFAPTERSRQSLLSEAVRDDHIVVAGNSGVDALHWVLRQPSPPQVDALLDEIGLSGNSKRQNGQPDSVANPSSRSSQPKIILVTAHRRENFGQRLSNICDALREIAARYQGNVHIIYPVHPNPNVSGPVYRTLGDVPGITLVPPLDYLSMSHLASRSYLIMTDSGGLQEEAPSLGKPVLVLREVTERPEGVAAGTSLLVGTETDQIVRATVCLIDDARAYHEMSSKVNPYGDGRASGRILQALLDYSG